MFTKNDFDKIYFEIKDLVKEYEDKQSFESAYLIKWQFIEKIVKELAEIVRKNRLLIRLTQWIDYLNEGKSNKPSEIKNFFIRSNKIPELDLIKEYFDKEMPILFEVLDINGKFRKKRNSIAHSFEPFKKYEKYKEYSNKLDKAINELRNELS